MWWFVLNESTCNGRWEFVWALATEGFKTTQMLRKYRILHILILITRIHSQHIKHLIANEMRMADHVKRWFYSRTCLPVCGRQLGHCQTFREVSDMDGKRVGRFDANTRQCRHHGCITQGAREKFWRSISIYSFFSTSPCWQHHILTRREVLSEGTASGGSSS